MVQFYFNILIKVMIFTYIAKNKFQLIHKYFIKHKLVKHAVPMVWELLKIIYLKWES